MKGNLYNKSKKSSEIDKRVLITVSVVGSAGPLRFVVKEDDLVYEVIHTALKSYAREGRLPLLSLDATNFLLYCANTEEPDGLSPGDRIGSKQARNFVLYKKQGTPSTMPNQKIKKLMSIKESHGWKAWINNHGWKAWINKSLSFKILSH